MAEHLIRLESIFRDVLDNPSLRLNVYSNASNVEGWDSLAHINLITTIEQEFGVRFALAELERLDNVGGMIALIEQKLQTARN